MDADSYDIDLNAEWDKVCNSYAKLSKGKQLKSRPSPSPRRVAEAIRKAGEDDDNPSKWQKLGDIAAKTGTALLEIGKVASQVASMFFGPTDICMNALSFFVDAAVAYNTIYDTLNELMTTLAQALERCEIYRKSQQVIDFGMKKRANLIMLQFVSVCELSYATLRKHSKIMKFVKITLFKDDGGVRKALDALKTLTEEESDLRSTYTYVSAKKTEQMMEQTLQTTKTLETLSRREQQLKFLEDQLGKLNSHYEQWRFCLNQTSSIQDSGGWIKEYQNYDRWINLEYSQQSLLILSGEEGCGKTLLVSKIVDLIHDRYPTPADGAHEALVLYHFFGREGLTVSESADGSVSTSKKNPRCTIDAMLRNLALQLAHSDDTYRKTLCSILTKESARVPTTVDDMWNTLFVESSSEMALFLLLDDLHELEDISSLSTLLAAVLKTRTMNPRIRVLVSGRTDSLEAAVRDLSISRFVIDVTSSNKDIEKYIQNEVQKMPLLQGPVDEIRSLRQDVCKALGRFRNFRALPVLLREIRGESREHKIREILAQAANASDTATYLLQKCKELDEDDVADLNHLLEWTMCTSRSLSLTELEAVLNIRRRNLSLKPLRDRIRQEFLGFFVLHESEYGSESTVALSSDSLTKHFEKITEQKKRELTVGGSEITALEVKIVQRFLKNLCDEELYTKFKFEDFFEQKLAKSSRVHVDTGEMYAKVALDCLKVVLCETIKESWSIKSYARKQWAELLDAVSLGRVDQNLQSDVMIRVISMFVDDQAIAKWLPIDSSGIDWLYSSRNTSEILRCVQNFTGVGSLSAAQGIWARIVSSSSPEAVIEMWRPVIRFKARQWLYEVGPQGTCEPESYQPFLWVRAFLNKINHTRDNRLELLLRSEYSTDEILKSEIEATAKWAMKESETSELSYISYCCLGYTYLHFKYGMEAKDLFLAAIKLRDNPWEASRGLAQVWALLNHYQNAISCLSGLTYPEYIVAKDSNDLDPILNDHIQCVRWLCLLGETKNAVDVINTIRLERLPHQGSRLDLELFYHQYTLDAASLEDALTRASRFRRRGRDTGLRFVIRHIAPDRQKSQAIVESVRRAGQIDLMQDIHGEIVHKLEEDHITRGEDFNDQSTLQLASMYNLAADTIYRYPRVETSLEEAIDLLERSLKVRPSPNDINRSRIFNTQRDAALRLCLHYLYQARRPSLGPEVVQSLLAKVKVLCTGEAADEYQPLNSFVTVSHAQLMLGRYYASVNDTAHAREQLRPHVSDAIAILSDDDPDNDWKGFFSLANAFVHYGDDANALAAFWLIAPTVNLPTLEEEETSASDIAGSSPSQQSEESTDLVSGLQKRASATAPDNEGGSQTEPHAKVSLKSLTPSYPGRKPIGPMELVCNGSCGTRFTYASDMYVCRDCPNVIFTEDCLEKMRRGELVERICDPAHTFFHVPEWDFRRSARVGKGNVMVGTAIVPFHKWLDEIKETWSISE